MNFEKSIHTALWGSESWEISAHPSDPSVIADGEETGRRLNEIYPNFPLLFKVIDAKTRLSVQVHPNEETCKVTGGEPKTEMWCALSDGPIYAGLKKGASAADVEAAVKSGRFEELFFKDFREGGTLVQQTFCRFVGEGVGILAARHFLRDIASPLASREEQMEMGDCSIAAQPQRVILAGLTPEAQEHFTAAMRRAKGRGGKGRQINERQRKDRNEVVTEMRRLKEIAEREKRTLTWLEIVERLKRSPVYAKKLIGVADVSWVSYAKRR